MRGIKRGDEMRFSVVQLLFLVSYVAVATVSLKYAGLLWWTLLSSLGLLIFAAIVVSAFLGSGKHRDFFIGFAVCVTIYGLCLHFHEADLAFQVAHRVFTVPIYNRYVDEGSLIAFVADDLRVPCVHENLQPNLYRRWGLLFSTSQPFTILSRHTPVLGGRFSQCA